MLVENNRKKINHISFLFNCEPACLVSRLIFQCTQEKNEKNKPQAVEYKTGGLYVKHRKPLCNLCKEKEVSASVPLSIRLKPPFDSLRLIKADP